MDKPERESVVLETVRKSELPEAWRKRLKVGADEPMAVKIARRTARTSKRPNATFGMWADRVLVNSSSRHIRPSDGPRLEAFQPR